jgi:hypothetical protein
MSHRPFVPIELYQTIVCHFQQKGLARPLVRDIGAFHDFVDFEWLLAERAQNVLSLIQHDQTPTAAEGPSARAQLPGATLLRRKDTGSKIHASVVPGATERHHEAALGGDVAPLRFPRSIA